MKQWMNLKFWIQTKICSHTNTDTFRNVQRFSLWHCAWRMVLFIKIAVFLHHHLLKCCHIGFPCLRSTKSFGTFYSIYVCSSLASLNIFVSNFTFPISLCSSKCGGSALIRNVQHASMLCVLGDAYRCFRGKFVYVIN